MNFLVYGSLRRGMALDLVRTLEQYNIEHTSHGEVKVAGSMFDLGSFPAALLGGDSEIICELISVKHNDDAVQVLALLDRIEGYPDNYNRTLLNVNGKKAWLYHMTEADEDWLSVYDTVPGGDWVAYLKNPVGKSSKGRLGFVEVKHEPENKSS